MQIVRPIKTQDLEKLFELASKTGGGMTSMPADYDLLKKRISTSVESCKGNSNGSNASTFFMVLEDVESGDLVGTTAIYTNIGREHPFYSYKVMRVTQRCTELDKVKEIRLLTLTNDYTGTTEIGSLFLLPEYRFGGNGMLLSRSRYMVMCNHPEKFDEKIIAEMRGYRDENDHSPVWEHLGVHFFGMAFDEADVMSSGIGDNSFIADLMPKYPIYIDLLHSEAREAIGKIFEATAPALHMLEKEGFHYNDYVDIFDGGPTVEAYRENIFTIKHAQPLTISSFQDLPETKNKMLISTTTLIDFKACLADVLVKGDSVVISESLAKVLGVGIGDKLSVAPGRVG
ncbi:MAG: arginine N-succinyltransferase [Gammaproteobacteria bacterium]|nr:arginine N-succinyltransferase [Gammaproteobacteria bacterium]